MNLSYSCGGLCDVQTGSARDTLITLIDTFVIVSRADLHKRSQIKVLFNDLVINHSVLLTIFHFPGNFLDTFL